MKRLAAPSMALLVLVAGCSQADLDLDDPMQRGSYAQGFLLGEQGQSIPFDADAFVAGVRAGLSGEGELDQQQLQQAMMEFQEFLNESRSAAGAAALVAGAEFLAENGARDGVMTTPSGVQYEILRQGDGPLPLATDRVVVHYRGTLIDGTVFDESYSGGEPSTFDVGGVIPGFSEGLQMMPVGSQFRIFVPGPLGYGANPRPGGAIGPNDTLIFEVELLEIEGQ